MSSTNIQIAVKVRPLIERELKDKVEPLWLVKENSIVHIDSAQNFLGEPYSFDHIFDQSTNNKQVYDAVVKPLVMSCLEGINSTIFAYGQTSSGKTHTMLGDKDVPGIIMYTVQDIFQHIEETTIKNFLLRCSYLEIYNEKINDLLDTNAKDLKIREDYDQMVYVQAKEEVIRESNELFVLMKKGMKTRKIGCTDMNERSSRSHTIFRLVIQSQNKDSEGSYTESSLSLVDLAGSERVGQMNMKGERQAEGVCINKSLTTLGLVIRKLSENEQFINYRDSKLTRLLQHSLGGNSKTLIICAITVAAAEETKSTLEFAQRAKYVKNRPIINEKVTDKDQLKQYAHLCQDYKGQIEKLRLEKLEREKTINALEDKISNIRLFTSENFEQTVKVSKIPQRRHTLAYYKPCMKKSLAPILGSEGSDESSDEGDPDKHDSPVKSDVIFTVTSEEDKENVNFNTDTFDNSPSKILGVPKTTKTPSPVLKMQKVLLEESYDSLKSFTSHEKQLMGQYDDIKELQELIDRIRTENIELRQQNVRESQLNSKIVERNKEVFDQLVLLRSILEGKPVEEIRRKSLHTITEEDFEMVSDQVDPTSIIEILDQLSDERKKNNEVNEKFIMLGEENRLLNQQLEDKENTISSLNVTCIKEKDEVEAKYTSLATENEQLKSQLKIKNIKIDELEICISEYKDIKEVELEILTNKISQLNDYKEEMHKQLSELQQLKKELSQDETDKNTELQNNLKVLTKECDELKQLAEYNTLKIEELEEENQRLRTESQTKADLEKSHEEAEKEITDLRQVVTNLECQLHNLKHIEEKGSKEVSDLKEKLILRENTIAELENCQTVSSGKWDKYIQEFSAMKEKYDAIEQDQVDMEKKIDRLTQVEIEYTAIISHIKDVLGDDLDIIDYVNTLKTLQTDNDNLKSKLESSKQLSEKLNCEIGHLKKEIGEFTENIDCSLKSEKEALKNQTGSSDSVNVELEKVNLSLQQRNEKNLLQIQDLEYENMELTEELTQNIAAKENLQVLINRTLCKHEQEIQTLTENSTFLHDQLEKKLLELDGQQKQNDVLNGQVKQYIEQISQFGFLEKENNRLKSELEDAMFQLCGEQKEVENMSQQLDEKSLAISGLEKEILHLKKQLTPLNPVTENLQELSNMNVSLREALSKKEEEIKSLDEKLKCLDQECTKTNQLQQNIQQLNEKTEELNKLVSHNNLKIIELESSRREEEPKTTQDESASQDNRCSNQRQQELEQEIDNLLKYNAALTEKLQNNIDLEKCLGKCTEEISELKNKCISQEHQCNVLKEENDRLKSDLEHVISQLCDKENYVLKICQELDDHSSIITLLEREISHLKEYINRSKLETEELQEISNINATLRAAVSKKEAEIKNLKEKIRLLKEKDTEAKNSMQHNILKLRAKEEELKNLISLSNIKVIELESLKSHNLELNTKIEKLSHENSILEGGLQELDQKVAYLVKENFEVKENNLDLEQRLAKQAEEVNSLKDLCSIRESELKSAKEQLNVTMEELHKQTQSYNSLKAKSTTQDIQIDDYKKQLDHKIAELDEKSELYNNILTNYAVKNVEIECLESENKSLKNKLNEVSQKQIEITDLQKSLTLRNNDIDRLKKENAELKKHLELNAYLQKNLDQSALDNTSLKEKLDLLENQFNILKTRFDKRTAELDETTNQNKYLIKENTEFISQLQFSLQNQISMEQETKRLEDQNSYLKQQAEQLSKDNIELNLQLTKVSTDLNKKQQETVDLKKASEQKSEEIKTFTKERAKLAKKMEMAVKDLLDMKRHLDKRSEELSHLKGKYNALEVQFNDCKVSLKAKIQELEKQKETEQVVESSKPGSEVLSLQITELKSKLENLSLALNQAQNENKLKTDQLKSASEETRRSIQDVNTLQAELEQYRLKLQKTHHNYERDILLLKNTISKLTDEKRVLENKLSQSEDRVTSFEQMFNAENQRVVDENKLKQELHVCKERADVLESQLKLEKSKVESLTKKLQLSETEIDNLLGKVNDLVDYKKRVQEKISDGTLKEVPLPRLSDEGRPLSPNELRKIKRQSIHDQRRGLVLDSSDSLELATTDCPDCQDLRTKFKRILEKNRRLLGDMEDIRKNNEYIKWENEYINEKNAEMAVKIKEFQENSHSAFGKIINCSDCKELTSKLGKIEDQNKKLRTDIEDLKKENAFLDRENEDMLKIIKEMEQSETELHNQLQSCKKLPDSSSGDDNLRLLQIKYYEVITNKTELEKELLQNQKIIAKYKNRILDMENNYLETDYKHEKIEHELRRKLDDYQSKLHKMLPSMEDKDTQATCDLHEKYKKVRKLAQIRRQEGNFLRAKLNLPPDCAVLPEDIQRQPTNV